MSLDNFFNSLEDRCEPAGFADYKWSAKGRGFGGFYFYVDKKDGYVHCDNEIMSREFLKDMLCKMVDNCVLDCPGSNDGDGLPPNYAPKPIKETNDQDSTQG